MKTLHPIAFALSVSLLAGIAAAHTTIPTQSTEGLRSNGYLRIGHGCEDGARDVVAQSVVFPTDAPVLSSSDPNQTPASLDQVIEQGGLAGLPNLVQDRSVFNVQSEKTDGNGNAIGFVGSRGRLRQGLIGQIPFEFTGPNFLAESCAKRLLIQVAIADLCAVGSQPVRGDKLNLWIPDNGSQLATKGAAASIDGIGEPATLIVNRDLLNNPLGGGCGGGFDLTVTPSATQVDRDLPVPHLWTPR